MRVAIDATPVVASRKGIGVVLEGLITGSRPDSSLGSALLFVHESFEQDARALWPEREIRPVKMRSSLLWETVELPQSVARERVDVLITARDRTVLSGNAKSVVWLFEVPDHRVKLMQGSGASAYRKLVGQGSMRRFRKIARRISHFVVSSEFTRNDLMTRYGVAHDRISLIYPGIAPEYRRSARGDEAREPPYILHFATGDPRDNTDLALRCFARLSAKATRDVRLVLAGVPARSWPSLERAAEGLQITNRVEMQGYVPADEMPGLFRGATIYFDPTLVEGFGLQLLEAMACGTPVVSSSISSVPEVVAGAGILAPPGDEDAFVAALTSLVDDRAARHELSLKGIERAARFAWSDTISGFDNLLSRL